MTSSSNYSFLNVIFFSILFQKSILNSSAENQCLNPSFEETQKILVEFYYGYNDVTDVDIQLCNIIEKSNGLISIAYRMGADVIGKGSNGEPVCANDVCTTKNRYLACRYKFYETIYNDCKGSLPIDFTEPKVPCCVCKGEADKILYDNATAAKNFGITKLPALVVDGKYDPCFTDYSYEGQKTYLCKAYNNVLLLCK